MDSRRAADVPMEAHTAPCVISGVTIALNARAMSPIQLSGQPLPAITLPTVSGDEITLGQGQASDWHVVVVYRGLHCPICKNYLTQLESLKSKFADVKADVMAISADPQDKAQKMTDATGATFPVAYNLSVEQMQSLGLFISDPRPGETDRPFAEPGLFVVNSQGAAQLIDVANAPFLRPDLNDLPDSLQFLKSKDYPVRGTHDAA